MSATDAPHARPVSGHDDSIVAVAGGLVRRFGDRTVLAGVDLELRRGEFVSLLGRSGSGKTTVLRALAGLDSEAEGSIRVPARRAVVFQEARLLPWKRALDNVVLGLHRSERRRGIEKMTEVGLAERAQAWPSTLSGGEAQRVALARALVRDPVLLLLDEPFGALDALTRIKMHGLLRELCAKYQPATLLITHDVEEAVVLSDRIAVLDGGVIAHEVPVDLPPRRRRADPGFGPLCGRLLRLLGVEEDGHEATG